jgi:hypothetical protein
VRHVLFSIQRAKYRAVSGSMPESRAQTKRLRELFNLLGKASPQNEQAAPGVAFEIGKADGVVTDHLNEIRR